MLAKREHSYFELTRKLAQYYEEDTIEQALEKLKNQNHQSDERFTNEFIQMRFNQGKGPIKIAIDLKQRGIENFDLSAYDFFTLAKEVRISKYSEATPSNYKEKAKQQRFLQSRGFGFDEIKCSFEP
ncbi:Regulatory protein RecX [uncultured Gammaproteobacteria bacterium]|jgi:regulatory protein|nr:Regulatory protein RecX [Bathymodiolus brooksi thiotrophic gill symbiont]CAC9554183.1 Regulatory protein RecX [uncultured Gammaproteobacteria bacterium]CAB9542294.1 Regulatory protein RecX [Bathymodiolus brooksi thiotrophic gill symbiont]CAC9560197.1 Regulatory protein RecX [uncultured Gammaproteobacteria bacterium]CAC9572065.1 Regulatory protein RecX [uncultured Gammaproteobacteria bacterium]